MNLKWSKSYWVTTLLMISCLLSVGNFKAPDRQSELEPGTIVLDQAGFEMVYVPAGSFEMGITEEEFRNQVKAGALGYIPASEADIDSFEESLAPQGIFDTYTATLHAFWIDRYEVTIKQYSSRTEMCVGTGECESVDLDFAPQLITNIEQPQMFVNWFDAMRFCIGREARLPTEEEWEYAASGPNNFSFPWGNNGLDSNNDMSVDSTHLVGTETENVSWVGAYDMVGNAGEWVDNRFHRYSSAVSNRFNDLIESDVDHVIRGGAYNTLAYFRTTFSRAYDHPETQGYTGVRCVRSIDPRQ